MTNLTTARTTSTFEFDDVVFTVDSTNLNEPCFSLPEVCKFLGYTSTKRAAEQHVDPDDLSYAVFPTTSGDQRTRMVNEPGLYALIFGSKLPKAREFRRKVFKEILPSIRKTGEYQTQKLKLERGQLHTFCVTVQQDLMKMTRKSQFDAVRAQIKDFQASTGMQQVYMTELLDMREELVMGLPDYTRA